jgi:hypothetical protein
MKHIHNYGHWLHESSESEDSTQQRLEDIEQLYALGMIDPQELLRERVRLRGRLGVIGALTKTEIELVDPALAETLDDVVNENVLDVSYGYDFTCPEEEEAAMGFVERDQPVDLDWQAYPDGTLDVKMYFPELGPDQLIRWTDTEGVPQQRHVLEYYESQLVSKLDPQSTNGAIEPWFFYQDLIQEFFDRIVNVEETRDE